MVRLGPVGGCSHHVQCDRAVLGNIARHSFRNDLGTEDRAVGGIVINDEET